MAEQAVQVYSPIDKNRELIRRTIAPTVTSDEFDLFIERCRQTGLDPIARQIYAIGRYDAQVGGNKMSIQVSIDGMRLLAERSGKYAGQLGPLFCGEDGKEWHEVWTSNKPPYAAKVGILRSDFQQPLWSVAKYAEYVQCKKDGNPMGLWAKMPDLMLAKCAESLALRRAFPYETSGLYTREEMMQADNDLPAQVLASEAVDAEVVDVMPTPAQGNGRDVKTRDEALHDLAKPGPARAGKTPTNGDGTPATPKPYTLDEVKSLFGKLYKPERWTPFVVHVLGMPVDDEGLSDSEIDQLHAALVEARKSMAR